MSKAMEQVRQDLPDLRGPVPGPRALAIMERDANVISPSYTRGYPLVADSGEGAIVQDVDGNRFLDFNAGIAVVATGHCHPRVVEAIQKQAARLIRRRGHRRRHQAGALVHQTRQDRRLLRQLSRPHFGSALAHRAQGGTAGGLRSVAARSGARALSRLLPLPVRPAGRNLRSGMRQAY